MNLINHIAMSLYQFNVAPGERAQKIFDHFQGACAHPDELMRLIDSTNWATEMAQPTAEVYLQHAIERYGKEAKDRWEINA